MTSRSLSRRRRAVCLLGAAATLLLLAGWDVSFALAVLPAIALFALLACGIRPGEELLVRLRTRTRRRVRPQRVAARPALPLVLARVGRLLHAALAMRPPPHAAPSAA